MKVIRAENLGKCYTLKHQGQGHSGDGLRHAVQDAIAAPFRRLRRSANPTFSLQPPAFEEFWALQNVSFTVNEGEVVGIIGRNGAGKSTLLKVLSRITEPTSGRIGLKGRVASLLEVGTGFHPELTGRENIFLNGAILGMSRAEVTRKFDEIVDFSGVDKFLDTPVKRYSSGMYVRLAFAVAAHLEPEILIVDEVLAVGDAEFQKKCLGKMRDVACGGRTVLFVSHNLGAVEQLCDSGILMSGGRIAFRGPVSQALDAYRSMTSELADSTALLGEADRAGTGRIRIREVAVLGSGGVDGAVTACGMPVSFRFVCENRTGVKIDGVSVGYSVATSSGDILAIQYSDYEGTSFSLPPGRSLITASLSSIPLANGMYAIGARVLVKGHEEDWPKFQVAVLTVDGGTYGGNSAVAHSGRASLILPAEWAISTEAPRTDYPGKV